MTRVSEPTPTTEAPTEITKSRFGRAFEIAKLAASVGRGVASGRAARLLTARNDTDRARELDALLGERVAEDAFRVLSRMKGLALKAGQMAATSADMVPEEYRGVFRRVLGRLYDRAEPLAFETIRDVVEADLGRPIDEVFARFDREPMAAASIGQVHRAELPGGEAVAVKVQYPEVSAAIEGDLKNLGLLKKVLTPIFRANVDQSFADVRDRVLEECDYRREADHLELFGELWAGDPVIRIPRVHREASGERVLTMELVSGLRLEELLERHPRPEAETDARSVAGAAIYRFVFGSLFLHRRIYADPHPGNFLFRPDEGIVWVLDFGCIQELEEEFTTLTGQMHRAAMDGRPEVVGELFGRALQAEPTEVEMEFLDRFMIDYCYRPFVRDVPFRYDDAYIRELIEWTWEGKKLALKNVLGRGNREASRRGAVWTNRILVGMNNILAAMESKANFYQIHAAILARVLGPGESAIAGG